MRCQRGFGAILRMPAGFSGGSWPTAGGMGRTSELFQNGPNRKNRAKARIVIELAPLLYQFFRRELRFFHHCDGGVRTLVEGMVIQKYSRSDRSGVRCCEEADLRPFKLPYYKVTRDDKRDKFTLQTDVSKCGHETHDHLLSLAMRAKVKATTSIVVALSIQ